MGEAQGKKVSPPPLRPRRSRRSRPLARSSHQRPRGSRRSDSTEEKTWRISKDPHKRPASSGEEKETLDSMSRQPARQRPHGGSCRIHRDAASVASERCSDRAVVTRWWRSETGSVNNHPRNDERRGLSLDWPATSADHAGGNALSGVGHGAESTMRAQAVAATAIAPITAITCRQPSADMPMCARPSAA